jgi:hypothetical protein
MGEIFKIDPEGAILATRNTFLGRRNGLQMPGALVTRGEDATDGPTDLFRDLVKIETALDGYTPQDYSQTLENLIKRWNIETLCVSGEAGRAQDQIMRLLQVYRKGAAMMMAAQREKDVDLPYFEKPIHLSSR